jgi:hypothetical protein
VAAGRLKIGSRGSREAWPFSGAGSAVCVGPFLREFKAFHVNVSLCPSSCQ